ncbi:MAG: SBBP repeat-containing protein [Armatimonadetes bacterium]|nr:SBBP repeat-containing protein [Armatimonadota bacterium]
MGEFVMRNKKGLVGFACIAAGLGVMSAAFGQVQEEWVARYNGPANLRDGATALALDSAGNVYVTGHSTGSGTGRDYVKFKYDPNGNLLWERRYNGPGNNRDRATALALDSAGNVYVTGVSTGSGTFGDYATLKYDSDGNLLWVRRYNGPANSDDYPIALAVDGAGNVQVTGRSWGGATGYDYATLRYDTDGNLLWVRRYNGAGNGFDFPTALAADGAGNVYVTGISEGSGTGDDYATLKYDARGSLRWVRRYNGPGNSDDVASALAVDSAGNVCVTGRSADTPTGDDYATLKYDANGNLLWVRRYDGPGSGSDIAVAVLLDGAGNVLVTGYSTGSGTGRDYATLKYDANGNLLWEGRYDGPASHNDYARALAVDSAGNVYVTGRSVVSGTDNDYATLKYDSDGNPIWAIHYDGPGNDTDAATSLAVDSAGNVYVTGESEGSGTDYDYATIKYVQATSVMPDSFTIIRGLLLSGGLPDLFDSDDSRLVVRTAVFAPSIEPPVQIEVVGTSPTETPTALRFRFEGMASRNLIERRISLYNYVTQSYEELHVAFAATSDEVVEIVVTSNASRFVEPGTRQVKSLMTWKAAALSFFTGWNVGTDQTIWTITP